MDTKTHIEQPTSSHSAETPLLSTPQQTDSDGLIAGLTVRTYFDLLRVPVFVSLVVLVAAQFTDVFPYFDWIVYGAVFGYLGWAISQRTDAQLGQAAAAGVMTAVILATVSAIIQFIAEPKVYHFFEIITQPLLWAVIGAALVTAVAYVAGDGEKKLNLFQFIKK